jgi:hydroxylamine reductase (hybrid-cluster protein)
MGVLRLVTLVWSSLVCVSVQAQTWPLTEVIDIHAHTAPDSVSRSIDAIDLAKLAKSKGMRAVVFKNHYEPTASTAYLVEKIVPGIQAFGGVDLNLSVGGMNPIAVEKMALTTGGLGRFVWMGTYDTYAAVQAAKSDRAYVAVSRNGELLPETKAVIAMIAKYHLIMATGHNSSRESLMLIREAQKQGIANMVVTHAMLAPIHMTVEQMREAAQMGAYLEFVYNGIKSKQFEFADYAKAIRAVGIEHCILSSDMGQPSSPLHPEGLEILFSGLRREGLTKEEIDQMSKANPARLLGLN